MNLLTEYIVALANLYGIIHKDKVKEIYNSQTSSHLNGILINIKINRISLFKNGVSFNSPYFESKIVNRIISREELLEQQKEQPFFLPQKEKLLNYVDFYYEMHLESYQNLRAFIYDKYFLGDDPKAEDLLRDIYITAKTNMDPRLMMMNLKSSGIDDVSDALLMLIGELVVNVRSPLCNGYTLKEISSSPIAGVNWLTLVK